jgi:hypothetical protein
MDETPVADSICCISLSRGPMWRDEKGIFILVLTVLSNETSAIQRGLQRNNCLHFLMRGKNNGNVQKQK